MPPVRRRTNGIRYVMRAEVLHEVPHLHLFYGSHAASVSIEGGQLLAGSLPAKQLKEARAWIAEHQAALLAMWPKRMETGGVYTIDD